MALEGFDAMVGTWKLHKNEKFDEYLSAMGVNFIMRKAAGAASLTVEISKTGDNKVRVVAKGPKRTVDTEVTLGEEFEETDPMDNKVKAKITWDTATKVLRTESNPAEGSKSKSMIVERRIVDGDMVMEMTLAKENISCKRYLKKV